MVPSGGPSRAVRRGSPGDGLRAWAREEATPSLPEEKAGGEKVKDSLMEWLLGDRRSSKNTWEDRLLSKLATKEHRNHHPLPSRELMATG